MTEEPVWLAVDDLVWAHDRQIAAHGGLGGVRDAALLEMASARPRQRAAYDETGDVIALAAAYGFALARLHPFVDGNKRTALIATEWSLALNGFALVAGDDAIIAEITALASGEEPEPGFEQWLRRRVVAAASSLNNRRANRLASKRTPQALREVENSFSAF